MSEQLNFFQQGDDKPANDKSTPSTQAGNSTERVNSHERAENQNKQQGLAQDNAAQFYRYAAQHPMAFNLANTVAGLYVDEEQAKLARLTLMLLGHCLEQGHVCVDLSVYANTKALKDYEIYDRFPAIEPWLSWCQQQDFITSGSQQESAMNVIKAPIDKLPLCSLYQHFLYYAKWADWEHRLSTQLSQRAEKSIAADLSVFNASATFNWQDVAAVNSLLSPLSIVVGGPGTGKTTTVAQILQSVLLAEGSADYRIALAAPTGKAAARMAIALNDKMQQMQLPKPLLSRLPETALTLHRLLGWSQHTRQFRYNRNHKLLLDCIVVDEVSMIDMAMFVALLEALPEHCRIILLGDPYQLASVSAGSVLADICQPQMLSHFSPARCQQLSDLFPQLESSSTAHPLMDNTVFLQRSYRFSDDAGIGLLARAVLDADLTALDKALLQPEVTYLNKANADTLMHIMYKQFDLLRSADSVACAFKEMAKFQLLCAVKAGDYSTEYYNAALEQRQRKLGSVIDEVAGQTIYHAMPIMMEKNLHSMGIYNGDMGLIWRDDSQFWITFIDASGELKRFLPSQIQGWVAAHAITVHKSQGSEYDEVAFACADIDSPLLSKEMLYTAITRSKYHFYCLANMKELELAINKPCIRVSALTCRLQKGL